MKHEFDGKSDIYEKNGGNHLPEMLLDEHNCDLYDAVRPINWKDPEEGATYDMLVIGGGAGGLVTAAGCVGL